MLKPVDRSSQEKTEKTEKTGSVKQHRDDSIIQVLEQEALFLKARLVDPNTLADRQEPFGPGAAFESDPNASP